MRMSPSIFFSFDIGRILAQRSVDIGPEETRGELFEKMGEVGAELMMQVISDLEKSYENAWDQEESLVTYGKTTYDVRGG